MTESENILTYQELEKAFKMQYNEDIATLPKNSKREFRPNPVISDKPKYCLVALEPGLREENDINIKPPFIDLLFMQSYNNLVFQYCAYTFLCHNNFNYQITDVCKTPLSQIEHDKREEFFKKWDELLKKEFEFYNNPIIIPIGIDSRKHVKNMKNAEKKIAPPHYSKNANRAAIYSRISKTIGTGVEFQNKAMSIVEDVRKFTIENLIPHLQSTSTIFPSNKAKLNIDTLNTLFDFEKDKNKLNRIPVIRYLAYEELFSKIADKYSK